MGRLIGTTTQYTFLPGTLPRGFRIPNENSYSAKYNWFVILFALTMRSHRSFTNLSPVQQVTRGQLSQLARLVLFVKAGGRCEFDGCNRYLLEHPLTLTEGNFGELAHIVAFKPEGPRGAEGIRPEAINDVSNLMLMCAACHKLVDDHPQEYSRATLEAYKTRHEARIALVTSLGPELKTAVVILKAPIGNHTVDIPFTHIVEAIAPKYPVSRNATIIDLTAMPAETNAMIAAAIEAIPSRLRPVFEPGGAASQSGHVSVFALAPIPILIFFGTQLSNKVPTDVYQRHRDSENWKWKSDAPVDFEFSKVREGRNVAKVALVLSLSGRIDPSTLPERTNDASVYEVRPLGRQPSPTLLRSRTDLERFRLSYQAVLAAILGEHGVLDCIDLFPAVPAPIAVLCGRELLPKIHPALNVYDYDKTVGGFRERLTVNGN